MVLLLRRQAGHAFAHRQRRISRMIAVVTVLGALAAGLSVWRLVLVRETAALARQAHTTAQFHAESLNTTLDKYRLIPPLVSQSAEVKAMFEGPRTPAVDAEARRVALTIAGYSGASVVRDAYFIDADGTVFGASRGTSGTPPNVAREPFFRIAMEGRLGRQFKARPGELPSYVFASAIRHGSRSAGVLAIEIWFDRVEETWSLSRDPIFVTDNSGRVLLANRSAWRGAPVSGQDGGLFADVQPVMHPTSAFERAPAFTSYVHEAWPLTQLGWELHVLVNRAPASETARLAGVVAALSTVLAGLIAFVVHGRAVQRWQRARRDRATALRLERIVRDRTAALGRTQAELVQSAKLAAIGQMAATLSHEYNQPLGALAAQAANARQFLERGMSDATREAIGRIEGLVQRMSELSRALRGFARKPGTGTRPVMLAQIAQEVQVLIGPRARSEGVQLTFAVDPEHRVQAGRVRLSQILVNLIANALDALKDDEHAARAGKAITVTSSATEGGIVLAVEDNGPGINRAVREQVFEPFYTTKDNGMGLGLGLSIVYNIVQDFGAHIHVEPVEPRGARFVVVLRVGDAETQDQLAAE